MKNKRRLITPGPVFKDNFELKWRCVEDQCVEAAKSINKSLKQQNPDRKFYNVSLEEEKGLSKLCEKRSESNVVFFKTDKSGRMAVDDVENFSVKMKPHLECGVEVPEERVMKIENEMNERAKA